MASSHQLQPPAQLATEPTVTVNHGIPPPEADPVVRKQVVQDLMAQLQGTYNFMQVKSSNRWLLLRDGRWKGQSFTAKSDWSSKIWVSLHVEVPVRQWVTESVHPVSAETLSLKQTNGKIKNKKK